MVSSTFHRIEEMCDGSSVAGTVLCKVGSFSMVTRDKDTAQDTHEMTDHSVRKRFA